MTETALILELATGFSVKGARPGSTAYVSVCLYKRPKKRAFTFFVIYIESFFSIAELLYKSQNFIIVSI